MSAYSGVFTEETQSLFDAVPVIEHEIKVFEEDDIEVWEDRAKDYETRPCTSRAAVDLSIPSWPHSHAGHTGLTGEMGMSGTAGMAGSSGRAGTSGPYYFTAGSSSTSVYPQSYTAIYPQQYTYTYPATVSYPTSSCGVTGYQVNPEYFSGENFVQTSLILMNQTLLDDLLKVIMECIEAGIDPKFIAEVKERLKNGKENIIDITNQLKSYLKKPELDFDSVADDIIKDLQKT